MTMPGVQNDFFSLGGGLDLVSPAIERSSGSCFDAQNYEIDVEGGYHRINGYERFDGHASPSSAGYWLLPVSITGAIAVGNTVTGGTSGATGKVLQINTGELVLGRVTGTWQSSEAVKVSGVTVATTTGAIALNGATTLSLDADYTLLAANDLRADIAAVPGSGPIRGVVMFNDVVYAFRDNVGATAGAMWKSSASGWQPVTTPALTAGGRYEFVIYNFGGATGTKKLYGCDGKNKAFQFDGTTYTAITTGMTTDTPSHIAAHTNRLFLTFDSSVQFSPVGNPTGTWTPVLGAGEIAVGDTVTALVPVTGNSTNPALAIFTRGSTFVLYGNGTWQLVPTAPDAGAAAWSAASMLSPIVLSERGVQTLATTQNYGDFLFSTMTRQIQPIIRSHLGTATASYVSKQRGQYRLFYADGTGLAITFAGPKSLGVMPVSYGRTVRCAWAGETLAGVERIFFGSDDGYIYEDAVGTSFDGAAIESWVRLSFNHFKSPRVRKTFRRAVFELAVELSAQISVSYELGYGTPDVSAGDVSLVGGGGYWDQFTWDQFIWDAQSIADAQIPLEGTEKTLSLFFYSNRAQDRPHTLQGVVIYHTPRRQER